LCALSLLAYGFDVAAQEPNRQVLLTIEDLPAGSANLLPSDAIAALRWRLLGTIRDQKVPAVGFVNEKSLFKFGNPASCWHSFAREVIALFLFQKRCLIRHIVFRTRTSARVE